MSVGFSVDPFLNRVHRGDEYNCLHFAREVWLAITGDDIGERLAAMHLAATDRRIQRCDVRAFAQLAAPVSPCLALLRRPRTEPHVGVYLRRRILHLNERGVFFQRPRDAALTFETVSYYR